MILGSEGVSGKGKGPEAGKNCKFKELQECYCDWRVGKIQKAPGGTSFHMGAGF